MAGEVFKDVKIGDQFYDKQRRHVITITEITQNGAKYSCPPYHLLPVRYGPSLCEGGELYFSRPENDYINWDDQYSKVNENEPKQQLPTGSGVVTITINGQTFGLDPNSNRWESIAGEKCPFCLGSGLRPNPTPGSN